jgi:beta-glucosidase
MGCRARRCAVLAVAVASLASAAATGPAWGAGRCGDPAARPWCDTALSPDARAGLLLGAMTQSEKVDFLGGDDFGGVGGGPHAHTGTQNGVPRLGLPAVLYSDGPVGPRQGSSTGMPAPMALAATFDPELARLYGTTVADEVKAKGNDVVFAPTVNVMRTPLGGRTFEAFGEDPFLIARLTVAWIQGAQGQGVIADVKHFAANNQEGVDPTGQLARPGSPLGVGVQGSRMAENSIVDDRTLREIYLPQFEAAVKEGHVGSVMCSYNKLNGQYACENERLLQQILRREWGFDGFVLADYGAAHNTSASLDNGLDFEPWPPIAYQPALIDAALAGGLASPDVVDEHVRAELRTLFASGFFDRDAYLDDDAQIDKSKDAAAAQHIEEQAITLLRNRDGLLPLDAAKVHSIAVIGKAAQSFVTGGGSGAITPFKVTTVLDGIRARVAPGTKVTYLDGSDASAAAAAAKAADVAVVVANDYDTEGADRACLSLECPQVNGDQDGLIATVAAANPRTVAILEGGGPDLTPWRHELGALLEAWYPGGPGGTAVARVLFGDVDPGGRLPASFPASESQLPTAGDPAKYPGTGLDVHYKEGVLVGYRWYDAHGLEPAYPFGFGLSYTSFAIDRLRIAADGSQVSARVRNTGSRAGTAVPQLYLGLPQPSPAVVQPPNQLRGVAKVTLEPGRATTVHFRLDRRAYSYWDTASGAWTVAPGCYGVAVGTSSRDLPLQGEIGMGGGACGAGGAVRAGACTSRRSVVFHLPAGVRTVMVRQNGGRARRLRVRRGVVVVGLRGRPRGTVRLTLSARDRSGRRIRRTTVLHLCRLPAGR